MVCVFVQFLVAILIFGVDSISFAVILAPVFIAVAILVVDFISFCVILRPSLVAGVTFVVDFLSYSTIKEQVVKGTKGILKNSSPKIFPGCR